VDLFLKSRLSHMVAYLWFPGVKYLCRHLNTVECFICLVHNYLTYGRQKYATIYITGRICNHGWPPTCTFCVIYAQRFRPLYITVLG
jgi:hypothetical protein